jgi:hypothetical protein
LAWFLLRFGKIVARWALIFGVLAAVIVVGLRLLENARATRAAVKAATVAGASAAGVSALAFLLGLMLLASFGVIVWLAIRLKLAGREGALRLPPRREQQQPQLPPQPEPVIYYVPADDAEDVAALDLSEWGW